MTCIENEKVKNGNLSSERVANATLFKTFETLFLVYLKICKSLLISRCKRETFVAQY